MIDISYILDIIYMVEGCCALAVIFPATQYVLHMFQLNGYKPGEQRIWLRTNASRFRLTCALGWIGLVQLILIFDAALRGYLTTPVYFVITCIFTVLLAGFSFAAYQAAAYTEKYLNKKPLVYTPRVKRLTVIYILLIVLITCIMARIAYAWMDYYQAWPRPDGEFADLKQLPLRPPFGSLFDYDTAEADWSVALCSASSMLFILIGLAPYVILLANLCAAPIEKTINDNFIADAKKILVAHRAAGMQVIGITGSYGKTSVKFFLKDLLGTEYSVCATPSSFNTPMGLVRTIREHMKNSDRIFLAEMGARNVGDIKELTDLVEPDWGIITSVGPQHLQTFGSIENVQKTKFELADAVAAKDGKLFVNGDNDYILDELPRHANRDVVIYTTRPENEIDALRAELSVQKSFAANASDAEPADENETAFSGKAGASGSKAGAESFLEKNARNVLIYRASDITSGRHGTTFTVTAPLGETCFYDMGLIGSYNVINVLGAIAVAAEEGIPLAELRIPVRRLTPVEHRMQLRAAGPNATIIDDAYNSNPVGSKAAVETLGTFADGMKIMITPGMVELGAKQADYNHAFGGYAAEAGLDYILLVKGGSSLGSKNCEAISAGAREKGFPADRITEFDSFKDAYGYAMTGIRTDAHRYVLLENDLTDNY